MLSDQTLKGNCGAVRPGDCVVTFSRKNVFEIGQFIEKATKHRCAVIYGDLPPGKHRRFLWLCIVKEWLEDLDGSAAVSDCVPFAKDSKQVHDQLTSPLL